MGSLIQQQWTTPKELAVALLVHPRTIRREIDRGNLPAVKVGLQWRITFSDADKWLKESGNQQKESG